MDDHSVAGVIAAEERRCAAMLHNDSTALAEVLDERLQFHHSSGAVDDKTGYLAKMAAGRIAYTGISWDEQRVTALAPGAALLTGRMITDVRVEGAGRRLDNRVLTAWVLRDGAWRMVAFQSTPLAG